MIKTTIKLLMFIVLLCMILGTVNKIFSFKYDDGINQMSAFYDLEDTVDVLIIGSSHAFVNFNNGALWDEYGIASFNLGGSVQPMWNSYYYLKEALKISKPELIVLEGYGATFDFEYSDDSRIIKNTYGMKWSNNKIDAIKTSVEKERRLEFLMDYSRYHTRYTALNQHDFIDIVDLQGTAGRWYYSSWKGQFLFYKYKPIEIIDVSKITQEADLQEKTEEYYRKTIELAQENNIPIVVAVTPYSLSLNDAYKLNRAQKIAEEYDVDFINCNKLLNEIELDLSRDYIDLCHMTAIGSEKFSLYIGEILKSNYDISDRRGNMKYSSWDHTSEYTKQYIANGKLKLSTTIDDVSSLIKNKNYWVFISVDGNSINSDDIISDFLKSQGINNEGTNGVWIIKNNVLSWHVSDGDTEKYLSTRAHDFCVRRTINEEGVYTNSIIIDNKKHQKVVNGINIVVYDTISDNIVDEIGINFDNNYNIVR